MSRVQILTRFVIGGILFGSMILVVYFHEVIASSVPFLPGPLILILSLAVVAVTTHLFMKHEMDVDNLKYQFLTIATHKFRTPLTAIKWLIDSLSKEVTHDEKLNYLRQLDISVNRIMEVVDILTGLARFDHKMQYAYETAWLRQMIDVALDKYVPNYKEKNINFAIAADPQIPLVVIDKRKIQFVVDTLFENAIRYSNPGGHVEVALHQKGDHVILSVKDSGFGISKEEMKNLFRRFWRSNDSKAAYPDGMGLSLAMVREIMKKHGGRIWAESKGKGTGTTFFLKLPIAHTKPKTITLNKVDVQ